MAREYRCFGPPGTGKTTWLAKQVRLALQKYDSSRIFCASFTRGAAAELAGRGLPLPRRNIGTIHSLCYHANGQPTITETSAELIGEWNTAHPAFPVGDNTATLDEPLMRAEDDFLMGYNQLRNTFQPIPVSGNAGSVIAKWEAFKAETGTMDFTDLLTQAPASIGADVLFVDECVSGDTMVLLADGTSRAIQKIVEGQQRVSVRSYNEETGNIESRRVVGWHKSDRRDRRLIRLGSLVGTEDHQVLTSVGWQPLKKCLDLGSVCVLEYQHEDIRRKKKADEARAGHCSRLYPGRREHISNTLEGQTRKLPSSLYARHKAGAVSRLEVSSVDPLGKHSATRAYRNELWWEDLPFHDPDPSCFYEYCREGLAGGRAVYPRKYPAQQVALRQSDATRFGCMVHGRRFFEQISRELRHLCSARRSSKPAHRLACFQGWEVSYAAGWGSRQHASIISRGSSCAVQDNPTLRSTSVIQIQNQPSHGQRKRIAATHTKLPPRAGTLPNMRGSFAFGEPKTNLRKDHLQIRTPEPICVAVQETEPAATREGKRLLYCMWQNIYTQQEAAGKPPRAADMQPKLPDASWARAKAQLCGQSESESIGTVYCLSVEGTQNFFADGILIHNCQDLTPLQLRIVRRWGAEAEVFITAGDDDQVLYGFLGASAEEFRKPLPPDNVRVLDQSYRLPRRVYETAESWIGQLSGRRQPKTYKPRDDSGEVRSRSFAFTQVGSMVREVADKARNGTKVMILASCGYMLRHLLHELRAGGIPFHNPYRRNRGDWNPLQHTARRVTAFLQCGRALRENLPLPPYSVWWEWVEMVKAGMLEGRAPKKRFRAVLAAGDSPVPGDAPPWANEFDDDGTSNVPADASAKLETLTEIIGTNDQQGIVAAYEADLGWLSQNTTARFAKAIAYPCHVIKKQGADTLEKAPGIIVGTIHSVKGGEADDVYVFPDLSFKGNRASSARGQGGGKDALTRMVYVAMTRARKRLYQLKPSGGLSWQWRDQ